MRISQPRPERMLRLPIQATIPQVTPKSDIQISPKEYKRIIELERQIVTLSVNQASNKKQLERFINLERDVATIIASKDEQKNNVDRLASLERGVANLAASQSVQQENSDRIADLERGVATLSAVQSEQKENTTRLADLERGVATLSAQQAIHNQRSSRLLSLEQEVATLTANSKIQTKYNRQFSSSGRDLAPVNSAYNVNNYTEQPVEQPRVARQTPRTVRQAPRAVRQTQRAVRQTPRVIPSKPIYDHDAALDSDQNIVKRGYFIPAGCFIYNEYAKKLERRIASWGLPVYRKKIISKEHYFNCLFVGPTLSRATAEHNLEILQEASVSNAVAVKTYKR
ncbi:MAG: hypothetical protein HQL71_05960 [Magnetococcales bacterium]|nr:hypothetical protein [Magnetococcales bacterium]